jgi:hypothetical protein
MSRLVAAALILLGALSAHATNVLTVDDTTVDADEFDLILPIELESDRPLTHLRFDLAYDPAFCDRLDDPAGIDLSGAGRATVDPDDTIDITCTDGAIRIDMFDDTGAVVVPAGIGEIVEVDFGALVGNGAAAFAFNAKNVLARAGGSNVAVSVMPGTLTIRAVTTTTSTTSPPSGSTTTTTVSTGSTTSSTAPSATTTSTTGPGGTATTTSFPGATTTTSAPGVTTTTTPSAAPARCADLDAHPSFTNVHCALDALATRADAAQLPPSLVAFVGRARAGVDAAEGRCAQASTRRARAALRAAMRAVSGLRHRLGRARVPDDVRAGLADAAGSFLFQARFLRGFLACPEN